MTKEDTLSTARDLGVKLITWEQAAQRHVTNLGAWSRLFGYDPTSFAMTIRPHIIHPAGKNLLADWRWLAHELVHFRRQPSSRLGVVWWGLRYMASQQFRATEELHAHLVDLQTGRMTPDPDYVVGQMRDWYRLGSVDPAWMVEWLEERWTPPQAPPGYR